MLTEIHALAPLPEEAQRSLTRHRSTAVRRALASSMHLDPSVAQTLTADADRMVVRLALRRTLDEAAVNTAIGGGRRNAADAAKNPIADPDALAAALRSPFDEVVLAALTNPSTPESERRMLPLSRIIEVCEVGDPVGNRVVRTHETLLANRWLLEQIPSFTHSMRRAALALPDLDAGQYKALVAKGRNRFTRLHPLGSGLVLDGTPSEEMLLIGSAAVDLYIAEHPGTTLEMAQTMFSRHWKQMIEPHVLARLFRRFGEPLLSAQQTGPLARLATTRVNSTAWSEPHFAYYTKIWPDRGATSAAMRDAAAILGNDADAWTMFTTLENGWEQSAPELARAVLAV
jgi:hypothetical protein